MSLSSFILFCILVGICVADPPVPVLVPGKVGTTLPISGLLSVPEQLLPSPYAFGFEFGDGFGMNQYRREESDGTGAVKGSYGYRDPLGVNRIVEYVADIDGYRAVVKSNEPGSTSHKPANVEYIVRPAPAAALAQGLRRPLKVINV